MTPASICCCLNCRLFKSCFRVALKFRCKDARKAIASVVRIVFVSPLIGPRISTPGTGLTGGTLAFLSYGIEE